uniref:Uncharacterized protein n=1 Tax=Leersia perrieri TaxID=77586 RepID=A0A0D9XPY3_9ORYZ
MPYFNAFAGVPCRPLPGVDIDKWPIGRATAAPAPRSPSDDFNDGLKLRFSARTVLFICRGLMLMLWLYLFDSMRTNVTNYIGDGDSWFTKFVVFVVAVPMADLFSIFVGLCLRLPMPGYSPLEYSTYCKS